MMEPVAWMRWNEAAETSTGVTDTCYYRDLWAAEGDCIVPLVRLSDAEARIREIEAENARLKAEREEADHKLVDRYRDPKTGTFSFPGDVAAIVRRLDAAEALLKEAREALEPFLRQLDALHESWPDDMRLDVLASERWHLNVGHFRAARAISDKIGVNDE